MTILDEFHRDEQQVLDRLVDGELGQGERRELLAALDDEPGARRRCALAFLEAQTWRWQLSRLAAEPHVAQASTREQSRTAGMARRPLWGLCLTVAASLFLAFGLGTRFPTTRETQQTPSVDEYVETPSGALDDATELASQEDEIGDETPWETLTLASEDGADPDSNIQLRVLNANEDEQEWTTSGQSAVSSRLVRELEEAGWEVKRERRLVPVELTDGRRIVVPIEEVDLRYPEVAQF